MGCCIESSSYLKEKNDLELCYTKDAGGVKIYGLADADRAGDLDDRRSTTGYNFHLQKVGAAISLSTKKTLIAAISINEAEHKAIAAAIQDALNLRLLLDEMDVINDAPIVIRENN